MEFKEYPLCEGALDRRITFSEVKWLCKNKFIERLAENRATARYSGSKPEIHPYVINTNVLLTRKGRRRNSIDDDIAKIYIGKTIPKLRSVAENEEATATPESSYEDHEILGSVYNHNGAWRLRFTFEDKVHEVEENFLILCIEDPDAYYWSSNIDTINQSPYMFMANKREIPRNSFRAAIDKQDRTYTYIGRTIIEDDSSHQENGVPKLKFKRPKFYANAWLHFGDNIPQMFGKVKQSHKMLFAPVQNLELGFDQFETLCLKPSPASLKVLCRSKIREYVNYTQAKIKALNKSEKRIPDALITYLEYPPHLKVGEYMLRNEKLVSDCGEYELAVDEKTGHLVVRKPKDASPEHKNDEKEVQDDKDDHVVHAHNFDMVHAHRFHTLFASSSKNSATVAHAAYNMPQYYKFAVDWKSQEPTSSVKPMRRQSYVRDR